mgnify:CR=1 FL=1
MDKMKIRFLYFKECPNSERALDLLREVLKEKRIDAEIEIVEIKSEEEAKKYRFLGSPTIQINDRDIEKERRNDPSVFGCRIYKTKDGHSGVPPKDMIVEAIEEVKNKEKQKVLFICTHNSARSQMAEGILRALYGDRYEAHSAGIQPTKVNPYAIKVMREFGIDISTHCSKSIEEFREKDFDYVVTVCDSAKETCPFFPGGRIHLHKEFNDPSGIKGHENEILTEFRKVRDEIKKWIEETFGGGHN